MQKHVRVKHNIVQSTTGDNMMKIHGATPDKPLSLNLETKYRFPLSVTCSKWTSSQSQTQHTCTYRVTL